ncbi:MAG: ABC transporter permease [Candidatus Izemoplasmataceae bacterium]
MIKYIAIRVLWMFFLFWAIITFLFIASTVVMIRVNIELSDKISYAFDQYWPYIEGVILRGEFGMTNEFYRRDIIPIIIPRALMTLKLNLMAFAIYFPLSFVLGIVFAIKKNHIISKITMFFIMLLGSIPHFILMLLLVIFLGIRWRFFPGQFPGSHHTIAYQRLGYVIPMIALVFPPLFILTRVIRAEFIEAFDEDYNLLLKVKGLKFKDRLFKHMLRHILVPVLPIVVPTFLYVLAGSFFVERIYGIEGAADLLYRSLLAPAGDTTYVNIDVKMAVAVTMFYSGLGMIFALIVDISYQFIDPRMKIGRKKNTIG